MGDRRRIVAGNWKMHGSLASARELAVALAGASHEAGRGLPEVIVFPPYPHLDAVRRVLDDAQSAGGIAVQLGAQDVSVHKEGAHTGEVSAGMLDDCGCSHILVGHSERRSAFGESDELVARKFRRAADQGLIPVLVRGGNASRTGSGKDRGSRSEAARGGNETVRRRCIRTGGPGL